jgi:hypothetical protein
MIAARTRLLLEPWAEIWVMHSLTVTFRPHRMYAGIPRSAEQERTGTLCGSLRWRCSYP